MPKFIDLTGMTFERLYVEERLPNYKGNRTHYKCKCVCGKEKIIDSYNIKNGKTKSCGCLQKEMNLKTSIKHNKSYTRIYRIWNEMKQRCGNKNDSNYINWGGRGIKVCEEWLDKDNGFINFYNWAMANGYKEENLHNGKNKWELDRIDNDGNYCPENCRWVTRKVQANNKRNNRLITHNDETLNLKQWSEKLNISSMTLSYRFNNNWTIEKALSTSVKGNVYFTYDNKTHTLSEWAIISNINVNTLYSRIYSYKWSIDKALSIPIKNKGE